MNNAGSASEPRQDWARPVVHWALSAVDPDRMRAFYSAMFHWVIGDGPFMMIPSGIGSPETSIRWSSGKPTNNSKRVGITSAEE